ncbi:MAG: Zn-dependent alcohol dehydrogenase [Acidimicrobiales bacterium]
MDISAAVFTAEQPLAITTISIDDEPLGSEVLVRTVATGLCHSDLHVIDRSLYAGKGPLIMGHEGAGIVEAVGPDVRGFAPGDAVVACLSVFCGRCRQCLSGHPNVCTDSPNARARDERPRYLAGDRKAHAFAGIGAFAERMLLHENALVAVGDEVDLELACLVGCGVLTGVGAVLRTAAVEAGQSVAVFGCGGVGLSIVQAAVVAGAGPIIAVDRVPGKLDLARTAGATHVVDGGDGDAVATIRELTGGSGVDHAFEAVGNAGLVRQACESLAIRGTCTIVGVPPDGTVYEIPYEAVRPECRIQTCRMGSNRFREDIPRYLDFHRRGLLHLDDLVTRTTTLDQLPGAVEDMTRGDGARTVITFGG